MIEGSKRRTYHSLEIGRFVAALMVMLFHATPTAQTVYGDYGFYDLFRFGHVGVEYFFVLSGFLMYALHAAQVGQAGAGAEFIRRRLVRILPGYWIVLGGFTAGLLILPAFAEGYDLSITKIIKDFLLISWNENMIVGVSWTLKREFIFYGIFALCLLIPRLKLYPLWGWQLAIIIANIIDPGFSTINRGDEFFGVINLGFGVGMVIAMALHKGVLNRLGPFSAGWAWVAVALAGFLYGGYWEWAHDAGGDHLVSPHGEIAGPLMYLGFAGVLVAALINLEGLGKLNLAGTPAIFGKCSYALYLIHGPFLSVSMRICQKMGLTDLHLVTFICCVACVVASMIFYVLIEEPVMRWLNRATKPRTDRRAQLARQRGA